MTSDPFFAKVATWSEWKHRILDKYLHVWVFKLSSTHKELAFVDACAGAGVYADGKPGSPLIAARWNNHPVCIERGCRLSVHACEADSESAASLRGVLAPWLTQTPPRAIVYERPFGQVLPTIMKVTAELPTFVFIDPYGVSDLTIDNIQPLLAKTKRAATEVLIRLDPGMLVRFAGWLTDRERSAQAQKTAASFRNLLTRLNVDTQDIEASGGELSVGRMELFYRYLENFESRFEYVQIIPIRASYWAAPKYFLIHGTDNEHGAAFINDVVSTTFDDQNTSDFEKEERRTGQGSLFGPPPRQPRYAREQLNEAICSILAAGERTLVSLRAQLALRFGPDFREKDHKAAVKSLIEEKRISCAAFGPVKDYTILRLGPR